jgi:hypothetical protein
MKKSRFRRTSKRRSSIIKNIGKTTKRVLPIVKTGLSKIGENVKVAATKSEPAIKQGFKSIYGTLATGFNTGLNKLSSTLGKSSAKRRGKRGSKRRGRR